MGRPITNVGWEFFIYDSSESEETENVATQKYKSLNINYKRISTDIGSNEKVYLIYQEMLEFGKYEYVWICPDYIHLLTPGIMLLNECLDKDYDMIILNYRDADKIGRKEYNDPNALFEDCAWHMTSYMATVIRINTVLKIINWDDLKEKYMGEYTICHSHLSLYFEQLYKMSEFRAVHLPLRDIDMAASMLRKTNMWRNETFEIWAKGWPMTVERLPDYYKNKAKVIKDLGVKTGIFSKDNLIGLKKEGILTPEIYEEYKDKWKDLTNVKNSWIKRLSYMSQEDAARLIKESYCVRKNKKRIKKFCKKFSRIYLYGCGAVGNAYAGYMDEMLISYEGSIVTDLSSEKKNFHGHPVFQMRESGIGRFFA